MTGKLMRKWLSQVSRAVRDWHPEARIVLGMDACRAHTREDVVSHARRCGIQVIFVPAKLTWILQPLDTHVFSQLKRCIRDGLLRRGFASATGRWSCRDAVAVQADAITDVVVNRDWSRVFDRVGLSGSLENLRPAVRDLVRSCDLSPRPPTALELQDLLQVSARCSAALLRVLLTVEHRATKPDASSATAPAAAPSAATTTRAAASGSGAAASPGLPRRDVPIGYRLFLPARRPLPGGGRAAPCVILPRGDSPERGHAMVTRSMIRPPTPAAPPPPKRSRRLG